MNPPWVYKSSLASVNSVAPYWHMNHIPSVFYMFLILHICFSVCCPCLCPMSFIVTYEHHTPWCHRQQVNMQEKREYFFHVSLCRSKRTFQRHSPVRSTLTLSWIIGKCYISLWQSHWDHHKFLQLWGFMQDSLRRVEGLNSPGKWGFAFKEESVMATVSDKSTNNSDSSDTNGNQRSLSCYSIWGYVLNS